MYVKVAVTAGNDTSSADAMIAVDGRLIRMTATMMAAETAKNRADKVPITQGMLNVPWIFST